MHVRTGLCLKVSPGSQLSCYTPSLKPPWWVTHNKTVAARMPDVDVGALAGRGKLVGSRRIPGNTECIALRCWCVALFAVILQDTVQGMELGKDNFFRHMAGGLRKSSEPKQPGPYATRIPGLACSCKPPTMWPWIRGCGSRLVASDRARCWLLGRDPGAANDSITAAQAPPLLTSSPELLNLSAVPPPLVLPATSRRELLASLQLASPVLPASSLVVRP
jgi:hypothetical protein